MATYQTPGELGVRFYSGNKTFDLSSAPEWASRVVESDVWEPYNRLNNKYTFYNGGVKDSLTLVRTSENEIAFVAMLAANEAEELNNLAKNLRRELPENLEESDRRRHYPIIKALFSNHYDEAVALFEQDYAKWGENYSWHVVEAARKYLSEVGNPTGMKCVYYERELGDDAYAGVMISSVGYMNRIVIVASQQVEPGVYQNVKDNGLYNERRTYIDWCKEDPSGMTTLLRAVKDYNNLCEGLDNVKTADEFKEWVVDSFPRPTYRCKPVKARNPREAIAKIVL
jgi:hypothetical protein